MNVRELKFRLREVDDEANVRIHIGGYDGYLDLPVSMETCAGNAKQKPKFYICAQVKGNILVNVEENCDDRPS